MAVRRPPAASTTAAVLCSLVYVGVIGLGVAILLDENDLRPFVAVMFAMIAGIAVVFAALSFVPVSMASDLGVAIAWFGLLLSNFFLISFSFVLGPALLFGALAVVLRFWDGGKASRVG